MNGLVEGADCADYIAKSPENAEFAWCARFRVNLDLAGRFCQRCHSDGAFLRLLQRQATARFGPNCSGSEGYCRIFNLPTTTAQCAQCAADPLYRSFLRGQGRVAQLRADWKRCLHRRELLREEERSCCGGKTRNIQIFACALHSQAQDGICCCCPDAREATQDIAFTQEPS